RLSGSTPTSLIAASTSRSLSSIRRTVYRNISPMRSSGMLRWVWPDGAASDDMKSVPLSGLRRHASRSWKFRDRHSEDRSSTSLILAILHLQSEVGAVGGSGGGE